MSGTCLAVEVAGVLAAAAPLGVPSGKDGQVHGVGCRGRHSWNASIVSFKDFMGYVSEKLSFCEDLSAAHCDGGRTQTMQLGRDKAEMRQALPASLTTSSARKLAWTVTSACRHEQGGEGRRVEERRLVDRHSMRDPFGFAS